MVSYFLAFLAGLVNATGNVLNRKAAREEPEAAELYEQIGRLKVELEWFKKELLRTCEEPNHWID